MSLLFFFVTCFLKFEDFKLDVPLRYTTHVLCSQNACTIYIQMVTRACIRSAQVVAVFFPTFSIALEDVCRLFLLLDFDSQTNRFAPF